MLKKYYIWAFMIVTSTLQAAVHNPIAQEHYLSTWFPRVERGPNNQFTCSTQILLSSYFLENVRFEEKNEEIFALFGNRKERLGRCKGSISNSQATIERRRNDYVITFVPKEQVTA